MKKQQPKTQDEARQYAIGWQQWVAEQNEIGKEPTLYMSDLVEWQVEFERIAKEFDLTDEFITNGIL
jgi:hypothetical protein